MANYGTQDVICPYYVNETNREIICEGVINNTCSQPFRSQKNKNIFKDKYCNSFNYKKCPYSEMLEQLYK